MKREWKRWCDIANNGRGWMRDNEAWMCKIVVYSNESHEFFRLLLSADDVWITIHMSHSLSLSCVLSGLLGNAKQIK